MAEKPIRVLHVDDHAPGHEEVRRALEQASDAFELTDAGSRDGVDTHLAVADHDAVVIELSAAGSQALAAIDAVRRTSPQVPVILAISPELEQLARHALQQGADDYVPTTPLGLQCLPRIIQLAVQRRRLERAYEGAEATLRESERRYRTLFEELPIGLYRSTPAGRLLDVNPALVETFGYPSREAMLATPAAELYADPEDRRSWLDVLDREGELRGRRLRLQRADGTLFWGRLHAHVVRDDAGRILYLEGSVEDVTERRQALQDLRASEGRYRAIAEASPDGISILDLKGRVTYASPRLTEMHGYADQGDLDGRSFLHLVAPEARQLAVEALARALAGEVIRDLELTLLRKDGSPFAGEVSGAVVRDDDGRPTDLIGLSRDITERKRLQAEREQLQLQLLEAQKMQAMGQLAGGVAHDFNNLLTPIMGYSHFLLDRMSRDDPQYEPVTQIAEAAERSASLTRQLLLFSRRAVDEPRQVDLSVVVKDMEKMLDRLITENIAMVTFLEPDLAQVMADPGQMEQVLMNLVLNASDAMPDGGQLTISTRNVNLMDDESQHPQAELAAGMTRVFSGPAVCLAVSDTGVGIDDTVRGRIFEPLFTTKDTGTGLGLAVVYGIVEAHGGWIEVDSQLGRGTTFRIYLPRATEQAPQLGARQINRSVDALRGHGERVLVVEDDGRVRRFAVRLLSGMGYRAAEAADLAEARAYLAEHEGETQLLFCDVVLPDGTALDLLKALGSRADRLRVLLSSGYSDGRSRWSEAVDRGIPFIHKPYRGGELLRAVGRALGGPREVPGDQGTA